MKKYHGAEAAEAEAAEAEAEAAQENEKYS